jgi:hypothetical protein
MKKLFVLLTVMFLIISMCYPQDTITKKTGEAILAKVLEVKTTEIKFHKFENLDGPVYSLPVSELRGIHYQNGTKDDFANSASPVISNSKTQEKEPLTPGAADAKQYYLGYKNAAGATLVTSIFLSPLVGMIPAIACSSTKPREVNLGYPDKELMKNPTYYSDYTQKAKQIKQSKIWSNWVISVAVTFVVLAAVAR